MESLATRLKSLIHKHFPDPEESGEIIRGGHTRAAKMCGVGRSQMSNWSTGASMPDRDNLEKLAKGFAVSIDFLLNGVEPEKEATRYQIERRGSVAAGPYSHIEMESKWVDVNEKYPKGCFALIVSGKSCTHFGICDGDTVIVKPSKDVHEGRFLVVQSADGYTLKGYRDGHLWKWPESGELEPIPDADGATPCGYVIKVIGERRFGPKEVGFPKQAKRK